MNLNTPLSTPSSRPALKKPQRLPFIVFSEVCSGTSYSDNRGNAEGKCRESVTVISSLAVSLTLILIKYNEIQ